MTSYIIKEAHYTNTSRLAANFKVVFSLVDLVYFISSYINYRLPIRLLKLKRSIFIIKKPVIGGGEGSGL